MFRSGFYDKALLVSKDPSNEGNEADFFDPSMLKQRFDNQVRFVKSSNNQWEFHEFKMIEIIDSNKVKLLYTFIHPKYKNSQYLYFNKKANVMIEWLSHNRVFFYE